MPISQENIETAKGAVSNFDLGGGSSFSADPRYIDALARPDEAGQMLNERAQDSFNNMNQNINQGRQQVRQQTEQQGQMAYDNAFQDSIQRRQMEDQLAYDQQREQEMYQTARKNQFRSAASQIRSQFLFADSQTRAIASRIAAMVDGETARGQVDSYGRSLQEAMPSMFADSFQNDMSILSDYQSGRQFRDPLAASLSDSLSLLGLVEEGNAAGLTDARRRVFG